MDIAVVINPRAGAGRRRDRGAAWTARALELLAASNVRADVWMSEYPGHARELARRALEAGARLVIAWGGDGTVNEVGSAVAFSSASLGIIPVGSGNGLARVLGLPRRPAAALAVALGGIERRIDGGECDGRLFFNVAGVGLDAQIAARFAAVGRHGFASYLLFTLRELLRYRPVRYQLAYDGAARPVDALLIAVANGREFGNGARIAPRAELDDGLLDLVVIEARSAWAALVDLPRLYTGTVERAPGVSIRRVREARISAETALVYHLDGEAAVGGTALTVRVRPQALRVRVLG